MQDFFHQQYHIIICHEKPPPTKPFLMSGEQLFGVNGDSKPIKVGIGARPFGFRWLLFLLLLLLLWWLWCWLWLLLLWWWWVCLKHAFNGGFHFFRLNQSDSNKYIASFCNWDGGTQGFSKGSSPQKTLNVEICSANTHHKTLTTL